MPKIVTDGTITTWSDPVDANAIAAQCQRDDPVAGSMRTTKIFT